MIVEESGEWFEGSGIDLGFFANGEDGTEGGAILERDADAGTDGDMIGHVIGDGVAELEVAWAVDEHRGGEGHRTSRNENGEKGKGMFRGDPLQMGPSGVKGGSGKKGQKKPSDRLIGGFLGQTIK